MADAGSFRAELYWSRDTSDEEQPMVYIPGVSREGNLRPGSKFKKSVLEEAKLKTPMPPRNVSAPMIPPRSGSERDQQAPYEGEGVRSASLKDLCLEDKKRIANLIKELARVNEEKEVTEERLKAEQESFEKKIRQMEEQNSLIIKEREALQQQYRECQELLSLYQQYLSQQKEKLNHSLSKLGAHESKPQDCKMKSPKQPRHLEFDGSYLGSAGTQTMYPACTNAHPGTSVCAHHCYKDPEARLLFHSTLQEHLNDYPVENDLRRFDGTTPLFKNLEHYQPNFTHGMVYPLSDKRSALSHQVEHCCIRSPPRNAEHIHRSCQSDHLPKRHHGADSYPRRPGTQAEVHLMNGEPEPVEKPHRRHLPEERKQVLLLKKMELEIEKERLQQMLDQQEARLLLKQQQLQQSKADYSRFKHQHAIEPNVFTCNEAFMTHGGQTSGGASFRHSPLKPPSEEYPSKTSSSSKEHPRSKEHGSGKKSVGFSANTKHEELCSTPKDMGRSKIGFRRDASTSPTRVSSTKDLVTTATSPLQPNMSRYDISLLNLLEAMSPPAGERPCPLYQEPFDWSSKKPTLWSQPNAAGQPIASTLQGHNVGDEELEESRILEDIFFI